MIVIISLIVLVGAYLIANVLSRTGAEITNERGRRSMDALQQAKAALIAYAASEQWQLYRCSSPPCRFQPGALPCPANNTNGISAGALCNGIARRVGRLPWATIGSDDLRDASGEQLWYAVSSNFYKTTLNIINSDTQGLLTVIGTAPANNVVAIVFAPGAAIHGQNRDPTNVTTLNDPASYLEGFTAGLNDYTFTTNAPPSDTLNDRLTVITQADLMAAVEPVVAARIERDVKPYLAVYSSQWGYDPVSWTPKGYFPFPALFNDVSNVGPGNSGNRLQSSYAGDSSLASGLPPVTASASYAWTAGSGVVTQISGTVTPASPPCSIVGTSWQCNFSIAGGPNVAFRVSGNVPNAGFSLPTLPPLGSVQVMRCSALNVGCTIPLALSSPAIKGSVASNGNGTVAFEGTGCPSLCATAVYLQVTIPAVAASPMANATPVNISSASYPASPISITTTAAHNLATGHRVTIAGVVGNTAANGDWTVTVTDLTHFTLDGSSGNANYLSGGSVTPASAWFISNEWYRQTYYAVSPGHIPGKCGGCASQIGALPLACTTPGPPPSCLTVSNMPLYYASPNTNKRALLILAGRALNGTRPSSNLAYYLEGENSTPGDFIYEHRTGMPTSINDRVVVISP